MLYYILLLILIVLILWIAIAQYKKAKKYEETIINYFNILNDAYAKIKEVDRKGAFEADDEVGYAFNAIKYILSEIKKIMQLNDEE